LDKGLAEYRKGLELLSQDRTLEALGCLERAYQVNPDSAEIMSYFALLNALERGQIRRSVELCRLAIARQPGRPDFYVNLGRVHLKGHQKKEAVEAFREGIRAAPDDPDLQEYLGRLGVRRRPFFPSLPRGHFVNKVLGLMAHRLRRLFAAG